jgi:hypothetical protein
MHKIGLGRSAVAVDGDDGLTEDMLVARVLLGESQPPGQELLGVAIKQAVVVAPVLPVRCACTGFITTIHASYIALNNPSNRVALEDAT